MLIQLFFRKWYKVFSLGYTSLESISFSNQKGIIEKLNFIPGNLISKFDTLVKGKHDVRGYQILPNCSNKMNLRQQTVLICWLYMEWKNCNEQKMHFLFLNFQWETSVRIIQLSNLINGKYQWSHSRRNKTNIP